MEHWGGFQAQLLQAGGWLLASAITEGPAASGLVAHSNCVGRKTCRPEPHPGQVHLNPEKQAPAQKAKKSQ